MDSGGEEKRRLEAEAERLDRDLSAQWNLKQLEKSIEEYCDADI